MPHPDFHEYNAIWDTGAVRTVISPKAVAEFGLQPRGKVKMYHANGVSYVNTYFVNLLLPNKMEVQILQVMDGNLPDADILLGMDVIGLGDFALTAPDGKDEIALIPDGPYRHIITGVCKNICCSLAKRMSLIPFSLNAGW